MAIIALCVEMFPRGVEISGGGGIALLLLFGHRLKSEQRGRTPWSQ